ncbi:hypothetical protein [Anaeromyxobacter sp. PSR-1]|uniref:hypothetical protein n=1 Tax=Anaeromyxobacter sp. PSR-1 TaxID=1300915 RepID=UPI0005E556F0|nr:hypothetical protein [Anaeromyxobacter sp. PSR-1]GAO03143.1 hypothetical protein PSR1_02026 [Anaeromyxobacter sp. PSR-1]
MQVRGTAVAAALLLAAAGCKTGTSSKTRTANASGDDKATTEMSGRERTAQAAPQEGQSERDVAEAQAAEAAPSARAQQGVGGKDPHPLPTEGADATPRYSGDPGAGSAGQQGRVPETMEPGATGSVAGTGSPGAATGTGAGTDVTGPSELSGRVALIDREQHEIAIDSGDATTQVKVADGARITVDGRSATLADIRQGAAVRARLDRSGDTPQAVQIDVTPSKAK